MRVAVTFSLFVATLPSSSIVSAETFTRVLSLVRVGSLFRALWICASRSGSATAIPLGEPSAAGICPALAPTAPAMPPVVDELGDALCAGGSAVPVGFTWPLGAVEEVAGVPVLVWAPLPIWFAGVVGLTGGVCVWLEVWPAAIKPMASPKLSR